jgi:hypothetical protein
MSTRKPKTPSKRTRDSVAPAANVKVDAGGLSAADVHRSLTKRLSPRTATKLLERWAREAKAAAGDVDELRRVAGELYDLVEDLAIELDAARALLSFSWPEIPDQGAFVRRRQRILTIADQVLDRNQTAVGRTWSAPHNKPSDSRLRCWSYELDEDEQIVHEGDC